MKINDMPIGTKVRYWPVKDDRGFLGPALETETRTEVDVRHVGRTKEATVFIKGKSGFVLCSHLELIEKAGM